MRKIDRVFVLFALMLLLVGAARTVLMPKAMNFYENRYANQIAPITVASVLNGSFQDSVDDALMDQLPLAQRAKQLYNAGNAETLKCFLQPLLQKYPNRYLSFRGLQIFGTDYVTYQTRVLEDMTDALDKKTENFNACFAAHPELTFYVYYIEKDTDINFETNEKVGAADYLLKQLKLPQAQKAVYSIDSFAQYRERFQKTDHHWNYYGSYLGYLDVMALLGEKQVQKPAGEPVTISTSFSGSKAASGGADSVLQECFSAYPFDFPDMSVTIDGVKVADYGNQAAFLAGNGGNLTYGEFYGGDEAETILNTGSTGGERLLIIGDSFDNAILKLLACAYETTYAVDLRYYETKMGAPFSLGKYTAAHQISKVLLIGNIDYYTLDEFRLEG